MAQRTVVVLEDDLDGGAADETVAFGVDGSSYEIDLSDANAAAMRDAFAPYVGAARRVRRSAAPARRRPRAAAAPDTVSVPDPAAATPVDGPVDTRTVRAWAEANGVPVNARGRLSAEVVARYRASAGG